MRKGATVFLFLAIGALMITPSLALSTTYTFSSNDGWGKPNDFNGLDHNYMYLWGINWSLPEKQTIAKVSIHFSNISDWTVEKNDILKIYLLDNPKINDLNNKIDVISIRDGQSTDGEVMDYKGKKFSDGIFLWSWTDPDQKDGKKDPATGAVKIKGSYTFDYVFTDDEIETFNQYIASQNTYGYNSTFGFGLDPDCHYNNEGIKLIVDTTPTPTPTPEPGTLLLFGGGLLGLAFYGRKRMRS